MGMQYNENRHQQLKWFHFLTSIIIVLLGVLFIVFSKVRIVEFNKQEKLVKKITKQIFCFCKKDTELFHLSSLKGVKGFQRGHKGLSIDSRHYDILLCFKDSEEKQAIRIMDTNSNVKAVYQVKIINLFMGLTTSIMREQVRKNLERDQNYSY